MKQISCCFALLLFSLCISCDNTTAEKTVETNIETKIETNIDIPKKTEPAQANQEGSTILKAKFVEFHLGDASHYMFEDETGKVWDFGGCDSKDFVFEQELSDAEVTDENQGFGSNKELLNKWFTLTCIKREQPLYQDGPMGEVDVISEAILITTQE